MKNKSVRYRSKPTTIVVRIALAGLAAAAVLWAAEGREASGQTLSVEKGGSFGHGHHLGVPVNSDPETGILTQAPGVADVSGRWNWSSHDVGHIPPLLAMFIGLQPEGPTTHFTCESNGTLDLVQVGNTFTGTATQSSLCTTKGGQGIVNLPQS